MEVADPRPALDRHWDLGRIGSVSLLPGGKSQHFRIDTDRGRFVLRRAYRQKTLAGLAFEHELIGHLRDGGFPAVAVVPTAAGEPGVVIDGRVHSVSVFVAGGPYDPARPAHLDAVARALAAYHARVAAFAPRAPAPEGRPLAEALRERLAELPAPADVARHIGPGVGGTPEGVDGTTLAASLGYAAGQARAALAVLDGLGPALPRTVIHGGCRRGSAFFTGDDLVAMIDFDSARPEARVVDLVVAVHDFAKIYGDPGSAGFKVHLDSRLAARFVSAYQGATPEPLTPAELEALPALLVAKRLKRALGRYGRLGRGEPLSAADLRKIILEVDRVRSVRERPLVLHPG